MRGRQPRPHAAPCHARPVLTSLCSCLSPCSSLCLWPQATNINQQMQSDVGQLESVTRSAAFEMPVLLSSAFVLETLTRAPRRALTAALEVVEV